MVIKANNRITEVVITLHEIQSKLTNHLHAHERMLKLVLYPSLIGIILLLGDRVLNYIFGG